MATWYSSSRSALPPLVLLLLLCIAAQTRAQARTDEDGSGTSRDVISRNTGPAWSDAPLATPLRQILYRLGMQSPAPAAGPTRAVAPARPEGAGTDPFWQPLTAIPRGGHSAVYDPIRKRVVVTLGRTTDGGAPFDAQALGPDPGIGWVPLAGAPYIGGREFALSIHDGVNDRLLVHGGGSAEPRCYGCLLSRREMYVLPLRPAGRWTQIEPTGTGPWTRHLHTGIYDPLRKRMLVFGGQSVAVSDRWYRESFSDLWELNLEGTPAWHQLEQSGDVPSPGLFGTALYDARRDRMLFVSGDSLWSLPLAATGAWTRTHVAGAPAGRGRAVLDPSRDRVLLQSGPRTWELSLGDPDAWHEITTPGPRPTPWSTSEPRFTVTWDPENDRMVLFGGSGAGDETWFLTFREGPRWELKEGLRNPTLMAHKVVYDPLRDRLLAIGGLGGTGVLTMPLDRPGGLWTTLPTSGDAPPMDILCGAIYDAARDRMLVHGARYGPADALAATWELNLAGTPTWARLPARTAPDQPPYFFSLSHDLAHDRLVQFGGLLGNGASDGLWTLALGDPEANWEPMAVVGTRPTARGAHDAIYDPVRHTLLVQGGIGPPDYWPGLPDTWLLRLDGEPAWRQVGGYSPGVDGAAMVHDPVRDQAILTFGEHAESSASRFGLGGDWDDGFWSAYFDWWHFSPPARAFHAAVYDPVRDRVIVSGAEQTGTVWALVFGTPVRDVAVDIRPGDAGNAVNLGSNGLLPVAILSTAAPRFDATTVEPASVRLAGAPVRASPNGTPQAERMDVNEDGLADLMLHFETAALTLAPTDTAAKLTGSAPGNTTVRGQDHVRIVGGTNAGRRSGAAPLAAAAVEPALTAVRTLPGARVGVSFALPAGTAATLDLVDVTGRRVARTGVTGSGGPQEQALGEGTLPAGVYWVRLAHPGGTLVRKAVVLP